MEKARSDGKTEYMQDKLDNLKRKNEFEEAANELEMERKKAARLGP